MGTYMLVMIAIAGFAAQLVDGGLGMGFGATSMTILTTFAALAPATASAVVNTAQLGTTVVSGAAHWRFGNVNWKIVALIGIPGAAGSFIGATVLSNISLKAATPLTATILIAIGAFLLVRFATGRVQRRGGGQLRAPLLGGLGVLGGFISASGGAGWGPVTTSTLLATGKMEPRRVVGTVSTAEILVTVAAVIGFIFGLWEDLIANLAAAIALLIGGVIAAPIAAWLISRMNSHILGGAVGTLLIMLNLPKLGSFFELSSTIVSIANVAVLVIGLTLSVLGARQAKAQKAAQTAEKQSHEQEEPVLAHAR